MLLSLGWTTRDVYLDDRASSRLPGRAGTAGTVSSYMGSPFFVQDDDEEFQSGNRGDRAYARKHVRCRCGTRTPRGLRELARNAGVHAESNLNEAAFGGQLESKSDGRISLKTRAERL